MEQPGGGLEPPYFVRLYRLDQEELLDMHAIAKVERDDDDRLVLTRLVLDAAHVDSELLRSIPISRIEATARMVDLDDPDGLLAHGLTRRDHTRQGELILTLRDPDGRLVAVDDEIGRYIHGTREPPQRPVPGEAEPSGRMPLRRPDRSDPEGFSRMVAEAYNEAVQTSHRPATLLAAEAGVPATTVHRWIREARQRGFLPPARRGRAG